MVIWHFYTSWDLNENTAHWHTENVEYYGVGKGLARRAVGRLVTGYLWTRTYCGHTYRTQPGLSCVDRGINRHTLHRPIDWARDIGTSDVIKVWKQFCDELSFGRQDAQRYPRYDKSKERVFSDRVRMDNYALLLAWWRKIRRLKWAKKKMSVTYNIGEPVLSLAALLGLGWAIDD